MFNRASYITTFSKNYLLHILKSSTLSCYIYNASHQVYSFTRGLNNKILFSLIIILVLLLSGCWDRVEIDERAFITALGFDKYEAKNAGKEEEIEKETEEETINRYVRTISYPNTAIIAGKGEGKASFVYSTTCISWADGKQQIALRNNKNYYTDHLKTIIIGEELAKDEKLLKELLDTFQRNPSINRKLYLFITPDKAQDILMAETDKNMDVGLFIEELMAKEIKPTRMAKSALDTIVTDIYESDAALAPRIVKTKDGIKVSGSVVLKDEKMVGMLGELETRDALVLKGETKAADYTIKFEDIFIIISQSDVKSKMRVYEDKAGKINVHFKISAEGDIEQHFFKTPDEPFDSKYIIKVNKKANELISKELEALFKKVQKEFEADIFKVGENLRKFEPDTWKKVKDNWDEIYPKANIKVDFEMNIRRVGIQG